MSVLRRIGRRIRAWHPFTVLAVGWGLLIVYAFPGIMTQDSYDHLRESRDGIYSDAHPPVINIVWKVLDYVIAGPFPMLVLQSAVFLGALYLLMKRTFAPRRAAWIAVAIFLFPPVMMPMAVIWKDNLMAGLLVMGFVGLLSERRGPKLWALLALVGATAFRYNALGATLPLVVLLFEWRPMQHWLKRYAISTVVWLAVTVAGFGINMSLTDKPMHYWHSSLALYDIVGTLAFVDEDLSDDELRRLLAGTDVLTKSGIHDEIRHVYSPRDFFPILNEEGHTMWNMPINGYVPAPQAQRDAIGRAWLETITTYPLQYAKHRISVTAEVLGLGDWRGGGAVAKREYRWVEYTHQLGLSTGTSKVQQKWLKRMRWLAQHTPLFVPFVYVIAALLFLPLAFRQRDTLVLLLSGFGMLGTLVLLAHSNDYRYSHWTVICSVIAAVVLFARRYRTATAPAPH